MNENRIADILKAFELYDGEYKRAEMDAAVELQEEITPYLIAILEGVLANTSKYLSNRDYFDYIYAIVLLAHFREPTAHRIIIDLFSLPGETLDTLFGDMKTEDLAGFLVRTCNGDLELIKSFALNKKVHQYCRGSALEAIMFAVLEGIISREKALAFFASLFTGEEADRDSIFWSVNACCIQDLYPEGFMDVIEQAYEDELIMPFFVGYPDFLHTLNEGKEQVFKRLRNNWRWRSPDNVHDYISSWNAFKGNDPSPAELAALEAEIKKELSKNKGSRKNKDSHRISSSKRRLRKKIIARANRAENDSVIPKVGPMPKKKKKKSRASRKKKKGK